MKKKLPKGVTVYKGKERPLPEPDNLASGGTRSRPTIVSEVSAKGVKGFLLISITDEPIFRIYKKDKNGKIIFDDYQIDHYDLEITIDEEFASLYTLKNGRKSIDYDSKTLGIKKIETAV